MIKIRGGGHYEGLEGRHQNVKVWLLRSQDIKYIKILQWMFFFNCVLAIEPYNNIDMIASNSNLHKVYYL
jgi:hypothetical protein